MRVRRVLISLAERDRRERLHNNKRSQSLTGVNIDELIHYLALKGKYADLLVEMEKAYFV